LAFNRDLERLIVENPDDPNAYRVYTDWLQAEGHELVETVEFLHDVDGCEELFVSPGARVLRAIGAYLTEEEDVQRLLAALASAQLPVLRELSIGWCDTFHSPGQRQVDLGDLSGFWSNHPLLEKLELSGDVQSFGAIDMPRLRLFDWTAWGAGPTTLQSIVDARWPRLETLGLRVGDSPAHIEQILDGKGLGNLRHLALRGSTAFRIKPEMTRPEFELLDIARAKILPQLETVDLSGHHYEQSGVRGDLLRLRSHPAVRHLKQFLT
jgi:uncharacterized protein (TIGR02996 family)